MALNVFKNVPGVSVINLSPGAAGCLHDYALTTDNMKKLANADLFIVNGAGMETFLDRVMVQYPAVRVIELIDGIPLLKNAGDAGYNPHAWVSISGAIAEVRNLGAAMEKADPRNAVLYRANTMEYAGKLEALKREMQDVLAKYKGQKIITFHEAFAYFAREFSLEIAAVVEREPGSEPSARDLAATVNTIRKSGIKTLFSEPQYPSFAADTIARETGAKVYVLDPAVSGSVELDAYLSAMRNNLVVLKQALSN